MSQSGPVDGTKQIFGTFDTLPLFFEPLVDLLDIPVVPLLDFIELLVLLIDLLFGPLDTLLDSRCDIVILIPRTF